ncbi:hypothetical protein [Microbulbifer halophilus]|uniref:Uncharacterized protein n=1 Tax=Microbulbifer halophilus TaxID=453963 RepID=A0ABW5EDB8_9GAMM|nr:hypothetical protein [Microbulbifer halophilus]MCW8127059.1 hypothetical protein [Microbulbifer halophilus]
MKKILLYAGFSVFALLFILLVMREAIIFPGRYGGNASVVDGMGVILIAVLPLMIAVTFLLEAHWPHIARRIGGGVLLSGFLVSFIGFMIG